MRYLNGFIVIIVMYVAIAALSMLTGKSFDSSAILVIIGVLAFAIVDSFTEEGR